MVHNDELYSLQRRIESHERRLGYLRKQIARYGGEISAPAHMLGQRDELAGELAALMAQRMTLLNPGVGDAVGIPAQRSLRVLLGATPRELEVERQLVEQTLVGLGSASLQFEIVGSQAVLPEEIIQMVAQLADIYLGLYGSQPGLALPDGSRLVADIELETAIELGRPLLLYHRVGGLVEPEQADFLAYLRYALPANATWREFEATLAGREVLRRWVEQDVTGVVAGEPGGRWQRRPLRRGRILLASLGLSPGAVTGLYYALGRRQLPVDRVITLATNRPEVREAADICRRELEQIPGLSYQNHMMDIHDIENDADAREFKGILAGLLRESVASGAEVIVGVTGGRTVMGALITSTVQAMSLEQVVMYHLSVPEDVEGNGRLPQMWDFEHDKAYWKKLLDPGKAASLVRIPYLRYTQ